MDKHVTIVVGIDFSDSSAVVLRHAIQSAESRDASVIAVHVLDQSLHDFRETSGLVKPSIELLKSQAREKFEQLLVGNCHGCHVEFLVRDGKPAEELIRVVKDLEAVVLIVSANDMTKKRLGIIAARCVRSAPCDVLVLRDWHGGNFQRILVCTDFSKTADRAIERAARLAKRHAASLEIVHVMYPPARDRWGAVLAHAADSPMTYAEECRAEVDGRLNKCLERNEAALSGVRYEMLVLESEMPSVAITTHSSMVGADLVVMGTQGHSPLASHFLGTNAERLIQDAPVSVLAVR
jgi:nucleotide-binding universal stress UspA family protein